MKRRSKKFRPVQKIVRFCKLLFLTLFISPFCIWIRQWSSSYYTKYNFNFYYNRAWGPYWGIFPCTARARKLVSGIFYSARTKLVYFEFAGFRGKKYMAYDPFRVDSPDGKIQTKKEPIRMPGFVSGISCHIITNNYSPSACWIWDDR